MYVQEVFSIFLQHTAILEWLVFLDIQNIMNNSLIRALVVGPLYCRRQTSCFPTLGKSKVKKKGYP